MYTAYTNFLVTITYKVYSKLVISSKRAFYISCYRYTILYDIFEKYGKFKE